MKKLVIIAVMLSLIAQVGVTNAQTKEYDYFNSGLYVDVNASYGLELQEQSMDYSIKVAGGYRLCPQFAVAAGFGGTNNMRDGITSVPVFVKLRSDFLDRKVSPYAALEVGYNIMFNVNRKDWKVIQGNSQYTNEGVRKVTGTDVSNMSDKDMNDVVNGYLSDYKLQLQNSGYTETEVNRMVAEKDAQMKCFPGGTNEFVNPAEHTDDMRFSQQGLYVDLEIGVSFKVNDINRVNVGLTAGYAGYTDALCVRTIDNKFPNFARTYTRRDGSRVMIQGHDPIMERMRFHAGIKVGVSF